MLDACGLYGFLSEQLYPAFEGGVDSEEYRFLAQDFRDVIEERYS